MGKSDSDSKAARPETETEVNGPEDTRENKVERVTPKPAFDSINSDWFDLDNGIALFSAEAEQAVLGSVLINRRALEEVSFLEPGDFYLVKHRWIWNAFMALKDTQLSIDVPTVAKELERHNQLDEVGGQIYLMQLITAVQTSLHAEGYGRLVQRDASRRHLIEAAVEVGKYMTALLPIEDAIQDYKNVGDDTGVSLASALFQGVTDRLLSDAKDSPRSNDIEVKRPSTDVGRKKPRVILHEEYGSDSEFNEIAAVLTNYMPLIDRLAITRVQAMQQGLWLLGVLSKTQAAGHELAVVSDEDDILLRITL